MTRLNIFLSMFLLAATAFASQPLRKIPLLQPDGSTVMVDAPKSCAHEDHACPSCMANSEARRLARSPRRVMGTSGSDGLGIYGNSAAGVLKSVGSPTIPVLLIEFQDVSFQAGNDSALFMRVFNEAGYRTHSTQARGSVRDYFVDQSYGMFSPKFQVVGKVKVAQTRAYYGANTARSKQRYMGDLYQEAVNLARANGVDFAPFSDGDGVPLIVFIHAGPGEHDSFEEGRENYIWAHFMESRITTGATAIRSYFIGSELQQSYLRDAQGNVALNGQGKPTVASSSLEGIGVLCHEMGHALGLPDFYNTSSSAEIFYTPDLFDVMDYAQYNGNGHRPGGYSAYERSYMGWLQLTELNSFPANHQLAPLHLTTAEATAASPAAQRAFLIRNPQRNSEYYVLENRASSKWFPQQIGQGMLIYHVDFNSNNWEGNRPNNNSANMGYVVVPADNQPSNHQDAGITLAAYTTDFFGTSDDKREFSANSLPAMTWNTTAAARPIYNIRRETTGMVSFDYLDRTISAIGQLPTAISVAQPVYDLSGRKVASDARGLLISGKRKLLR